MIHLGQELKVKPFYKIVEVLKNKGYEQEPSDPYRYHPIGKAYNYFGTEIRKMAGKKIPVRNFGKNENCHGFEEDIWINTGTGYTFPISFFEPTIEKKLDKLLE